METVMVVILEATVTEISEYWDGSRLILCKCETEVQQNYAPVLWRPIWSRAVTHQFIQVSKALISVKHKLVLTDAACHLLRAKGSGHPAVPKCDHSPAIGFTEPSVCWPY